MQFLASRICLLLIASLFFLTSSTASAVTLDGALDMPSAQESAEEEANEVAEEEDVDRESEEREDDRENEFDGEDDEDEEEVFGELMEVRRELEGQVKELAAQTEIAQQRIQKIDRLIAAVNSLADTEEQLVEAEKNNDELLLKELIKKSERLESEIGFREELIELEFEIQDTTEAIEEAEDEEEFDRLELLEVLVQGLREIGSQTEKLLPLEFHGTEAARDQLENQKALVYTNMVEKPSRALRLLEQLVEAEEEDDEEGVEDLTARLSKLRRDIEQFVDDRTGQQAPASQSGQQGRKPATQTAPQPIVVNEHTLSKVAGLDLHKDVAPLLQQFCFDCHSNEESSGELNFEKLLTVSPIVKNRDRWVNVLEQTKNHVMPPEDASQPSFAEREQIVLTLHDAIYNFDYSPIDDPGFESARRLTHREYSNTVRDLFGVRINVVDRFPDDLTATSGFDNSANSLFVQPLLMERYIGIAEFVVKMALPDNPDTAELRAARAKLFVSEPKQAAEAYKSAVEVMNKFLLRAYRRPPSTAETERFARQIDRAVKAGESFESAVKATLQTVLITPSFLLLAENRRPQRQDSFQVSDWEIATRLSYFLWASMPDDELFTLAAQGKLRDAQILAGQVRRMIANRKSDSLGTVFAAQWLGSQHLGVRMRLDPIDNPWCTETLMKAMRDETSLFFNHLVRENRPITELVNADYTFLNEELAKLYRIQGVQGAEMRQVSLNTKQRGGIFGQGSLLAVTSFPGRTSPVARGKWILDTVLGTPPPPPPPNVSELSEELERKRRLSFREKLELHREKPNCYACHSQMDPLGFSLENFDWFGRYRTRRGRGRIDSKGQLPNGTEFVGLAGLKNVIVEERRDDLTRQLTQKLLSYALGRQLEYYDEPAIRKILADVSDGEAKTQDLIQAIAKSYPFQYKKNRNDTSATQVDTETKITGSAKP